MATFSISLSQIVVKGDIPADDSLSGLSARNGVTPVAGDLMLATAQSDQTTNGVYIARASAWDRVISLQTGQLFYVSSGTDAGITWQLRTAGISPASFNSSTGACGTNLSLVQTTVSGSASAPTYTSVTATGGFIGPSLTASGTNPLALAAGPTTGYGVAVVTLTSSVAQTTAGSALLEIADANHGGNTVSNAFYGASSGGQSDALCDGYVMTASGAIADGDVCVWSAKNTVTKSAASAHLTTIAGVAVGAATGGKVRVATRGQVYVSCETGISGAGTQVGTSGSTAGKVDSLGVTTVGSLLGRTLETSGATVSGKILIQLALG